MLIDCDDNDIIGGLIQESLDSETISEGSNPINH